MSTFSSHRVDPDMPLEETMGTLDHSRRQDKAQNVGVSSYDPGLTRRATAILASEGVPRFIHQPGYPIRWIERELLAVLEDPDTGFIAFSPLAQGMLTDKHLAA